MTWFEYLKRSWNKKVQKWCLFYKLAAEKKTTFLVQLEFFCPFLFCGGFKGLKPLSCSCKLNSCSDLGMRLWHTPFPRVTCILVYRKFTTLQSNCSNDSINSKSPRLGVCKWHWNKSIWKWSITPTYDNPLISNSNSAQCQHTVTTTYKV